MRQRLLGSADDNGKQRCWPASCGRRPKLRSFRRPTCRRGILGFANPATDGRIVVAHCPHGKRMLETAGHEAAHFIFPHLSAAQKVILLRELPRGMPMPNADEDLAERIGCWCAAQYRRERLPALSPQAARIMRNILYGDYWFRQKEKPEQAILAIALMPVVAMAGLLIMLFVVLISHL